jgi:hypothetical protein
MGNHPRHIRLIGKKKGGYGGHFPRRGDTTRRIDVATLWQRKYGVLPQ